MKCIVVILIVAALLRPHACFAQQNKIDSLFAKGDTTAVMDSLMKDFNAFVDSLTRPKSFVSVIVGLGNRTFSIKNNSLNTEEATTDQLSFTPSVGYYHKSGLGITLTGFVSTLNNSPDLYQYAIMPSYDYIGEKVSAGLSYTRYLAKDMAVQSSSPYENDLYGYYNIIRKSWRYGVTAGYATGSFSDKLSYRDSALRYNPLTMQTDWIRYLVTVNSENKIKEFSLSASVRKEFEWYGLLKKNDALTFSITSYLVAGSSKINTTSTGNINLAARKINLARLKRSYESKDGNKMQLQSAALTFSLFYTVGKFNVLPTWFMDYYFPDTDKRFSQVFSLALGFNF